MQCADLLWDCIIFDVSFVTFWGDRCIGGRILLYHFFEFANLASFYN